jgi:hypothetical protein
MELLKNLHEDITQLIQTVESEIVPVSDAALNWKENPEWWSILECLEHLNRYSVYYNEALARALSAHPSTAAKTMKYSWFGRKSLKIVDPRNVTPIKTMKHMNPAKSELDRTVVDAFLSHQKTLLDLLLKAEKADLNKKAIKVEFMKFIKLRIGEALEFIVRHEQRHVAQAMYSLKAQ